MALYNEKLESLGQETLSPPSDFRQPMMYCMVPPVACRKVSTIWASHVRAAGLRYPTFRIPLLIFMNI
jgi:hypothetical protein